MQKKRSILLYSAAAVVALAVGYVVSGMFGSPQQPEKKVVKPVNTETVDVLVAAKEIGIGDSLKPTDVRWRPWPKKALISGMITRNSKFNPNEDLKNVHARSMMFEGEPLLPKKLIYPDDGGFMSSLIHKGMRGISVKVSVASTASGYIKPLDRVDIFLVRKVHGHPITELVMKNVKVLALDDENLAKKKKGKKEVGRLGNVKTALLEVTPMQARLLAKLSKMGSLTMALRSLAEDDKDGMPVIVGRFVEEAQRGADMTAMGTAIELISGRESRTIGEN